jgi:hypothetical protein
MTTPAPLSKNAFLASLLILLDLHGREMSPDAQVAFYQTVAKLPGDLVLAAMRDLQAESWMAKPADVIERVAKMWRAERALVTSSSRALPAGQLTPEQEAAAEAERQACLTQIRSAIASLASKMTTHSPTSRYTVAMAEAEVRKLREAEQVNSAFVQRRKAAAEAVRARGTRPLPSRPSINCRPTSAPPTLPRTRPQRRTNNWIEP